MSWTVGSKCTGKCQNMLFYVLQILLYSCSGSSKFWRVTDSINVLNLFPISFTGQLTETYANKINLSTAPNYPYPSIHISTQPRFLYRYKCIYLKKWYLFVRLWNCLYCLRCCLFLCKTAVLQLCNYQLYKYAIISLIWIKRTKRVWLQA